jgi:hypothetical protein
MVITMSIIPLFTYPTLSLHNHRVIIVLCDLQMFLYPTNKGVTHVHSNRTPDTWTSCVMMTFVVVLHWLEAFALEVASGMISIRGESPPPWCGLTSTSSRSDFRQMASSALQKKYEGVLLIWLRSECTQGPTCEGTLQFGDLCDLQATSPTFVYMDLRMLWIYHPNLFSGILNGI